MSNIPAAVVNLVEQLNNKDPFWIRNNSCMTLENIRDYCDKHINAFRKLSHNELKKEIKR